MDALREAVDLYEGVAVNVDHPKRSEISRDRSILENPGWLSNVRFERGGLYGDLNLFENHPTTQLILEKAEKAPNSFGLSHNADGVQQRVNGRLMITKISRVRSVDIVGVPATTAGIFESVQAEPQSEYEQALRDLKRIEREHAELLEQKRNNWGRPREKKEKSYAETRQELKCFGRVLDPGSEADQALLESYRGNLPAHIDHEPSGEYERARQKLLASERRNR